MTRTRTAWPTDPVAAVRYLRSGGHEVAWLDSGGRASVLQSLLGFGPEKVLEQRFPTRTADTSARLWRRRSPRQAEVVDDAWTALRSLIPRDGPAWPGVGPGWIGYVGFEMAGGLERLPAPRADDFGLPMLRMAWYPRVILLDHSSQEATVVCTDDESADGLGDWVKVWERAAAKSASGAQPPATARIETPLPEYAARVSRALEYIAAGDIYQVNLSHRLRVSGLSDAVGAYGRIRTASAAAYGAFLAWDDCAVLSASPELFLRLDGRQVLTRPIKGTRPRSAHPAEDAANRAALLASEKDAAELAMIVDLHRNDIGRVCRWGSVQVRNARLVETHPSVFHTVAEITGELANGRDGLDLLMACFPAGSISGVPKIRALQIIHELETCVRGAYTGAIGVLSAGGDMVFNVAIRTLQMRGTEGVLHVGGGIVADSDPAAEYQETLDKGRGILTALDATA